MEVSYSDHIIPGVDSINRWTEWIYRGTPPERRVAPPGSRGMGRPILQRGGTARFEQALDHITVDLSLVRPAVRLCDLGGAPDQPLSPLRIGMQGSDGACEVLRVI